MNTVQWLVMVKWIHILSKRLLEMDILRASESDRHLITNEIG